MDCRSNLHVVVGILSARMEKCYKNMIFEKWFSDTAISVKRNSILKFSKSPVLLTLFCTRKNPLVYVLYSSFYLHVNHITHRFLIFKTRETYGYLVPEKDKTIFQWILTFPCSFSSILLKVVFKYFLIYAKKSLCFLKISNVKLIK